MNYPRAIQISRLLSHMNNSVTIWSCFENSRIDDSLKVLLPNGPGYSGKKPVLNTNHLIVKALLRLSYPDHNLPWVFRSYLEIKHNIDSFDGLVTFGQPMSCHFLGLWLKKRDSAIPWVAHFSDPWAENPFIKNRFRKKMNAFLERKVFEKADLVIFTSQETIDLVAKNYEQQITRKFRYLPHSYEEKLFGSLNLSKKQKLTIRHLGDFYGERRPGPFLEVLEEVVRKKTDIIHQIKIEFYGKFDQITAKDRLEKFPNGFLEYFGQVGYLQSLELMRQSDGLLIIDAPFENSPFFPSKLVEYIGAKRPIFALSPKGCSNRIVEELGGIVITHKHTIEEKAKAFLDFIEQCKQFQVKDFHQNDDYEAAQVTKKFEKILSEVMT